MGSTLVFQRFDRTDRTRDYTIRTEQTSAACGRSSSRFIIGLGRGGWGTAPPLDF